VRLALGLLILAATAYFTGYLVLEDMLMICRRRAYIQASPETPPNYIRDRAPLRA